MAHFTSSIAITLGWNGYFFSGAAGTHFWLPDSAVSSFIIEPGPIIPGLAWFDLIDPTDGTTIVDGTIGMPKFETGIVPTRTVSTLPTLPDAAYPEGSTVTLSTDGKLYRQHSGAWTCEVPGADLTDGSLTITKFASTLRPVAIVAALPSLPGADYPDGSSVILTTDHKIYRNAAGSWVKSVDGGDITAATITGNSVVAGTISAGLLAAIIVLSSTIMTAASGCRCELDINGFRAYAADGTVLVNIPTNGNPVSFIAEIQATTLTVTGNAAFRGTANSLDKSSVLTLQAGVQPPNSAPVLVQGNAWLNLTPTAGWTIVGRGYYDSAGGAGGATACFVGMEYNPAEAEGSKFRVTEWKLSDGSVDRTTVLELSNRTAKGITRIGASWCALTYFSSLQQDLMKFARADGSRTVWRPLMTGVDIYDASLDAIKTDGTYLLVPGHLSSALNGQVYFFNSATLATVTTATLTLPSTPGGATEIFFNDFEVKDIGDGNGLSYWLDISYTGSAVQSIYQFPTSSYAVLANTDFPRARAGWGAYGLIHDGTQFRQADAGYALWQFTSWTFTSATDPFWAADAWFDDVGTNHETPVGPRASITMLRRRQLSITTSTIPTGGADDPDKVRIYMVQGATDPGPGNYHLQATDALTVRTLTTYASGGAADGGGTAFPGGTGATLQSAAGQTIIRGDGRTHFGSSAFPTSPTSGDVYFRTDLNEWYQYDGTRWLSREYRIPFTIEGANPIAANTTAIAALDTASANWWIVAQELWTFVASTNDVNNFWYFAFDTATADSTAADSAGAWHPHYCNVSAVYAAGSLPSYFSISKAGSGAAPGTLAIAATLIAHKIAT